MSARKIWFFVAILFATHSSVLADTVLAPPPAPEKPAGTADGFPESRFGSAPAPGSVELGIGSSYAARTVEDMDQDEETHLPSPSKISRNPAGLVEGSPTHSLSMAMSSEPAPQANHAVNSSERSRPKTASPETEPLALKNLPDPMPHDASASIRKGIQEVAVIAGDLGFFPKTFFVSRDIPVRMFVTGASKSTLCIMMDSFQVRRQVRSQKIEEITFTPNMPGKYRFYCPVNGMEGTMIVKEFASVQSRE